MIATKAQFDFIDAEKEGMLEVLAKYQTNLPHHQEVIQALKLEGSTVLFPDEALYLAGIVRPYYVFLAERLESHPITRRGGEVMASTHNWDKLNPFSPPYHGNHILMPSGSYVLMRGMYGWSLYDENNNRHPQIQDIDAMVVLLAEIYRVGNTEAFEQMVSEEAE